MSTHRPFQFSPASTTDRSRGPTLANFPVRTIEKLRFADTDRNGHITNSVFAICCQNARMELLCDPRKVPLPPSAQFLMGTDRLGRDVASRLIYGARISLAIGILANGLAILIGVVVGAVAGYAGRAAETVLMRLTDVMMAFPLILLLIALAVILQPSFTTIVVVIAIGGWTGTARLVRGQVLSIKERDFIVAARVIGASRWDILQRHILPHLVPQIITWFTLGIAPIILTESALSYLGVGVQPPQPSWGNMIAEGQVVMAYAPWLILFPSAALILTVIAFNLVGDGLRDALFAGGRRA